MLRSNRTIQTLIVAGLVFSLSLVGVSPVLLAAPAAAEGVGSRGTGRCCCGTQDGRCCGMACCGVEAPQPQRSPVPHEKPGELPLLLSLSLDVFRTAPQQVTVASAGSRGVDQESAVAGVRRHTLQALHVLLQT